MTSPNPPGSLSRRDFLRLGTGAAALATLATQSPAAPPAPARARIPSSGLEVTRVGLGTWQTFDAGSDSAKRAQLREVLRAFAAAGGNVIDTSPMYGSSPTVLGDLLRDTGLRDSFFLATKVWTSGREAGERQMQEQLAQLQTERVELMQIHNLVDWRTHLTTLRRWQESGRARHIGITHYARGAGDDLARIVRQEKLDFVQYALSLEEPAAADSLLQTCADHGVAFIANRPFAEGDAFARVRGKSLPPWAEELGIATWGHFLLKWILSHPEVTCTIPGTSNPARVTENVGAAAGPIPTPLQRDRMRAYWKSL